MHIRKQRYMFLLLLLILTTATLLASLLSSSQQKRALSEYDRTHSEAQESIDASSTSLGALEALNVTNPHRVSLGGRGLIVSVLVLGPTENDLSIIRKASTQLPLAIELLQDQIRLQYPGIPHAPSIDLNEVMVQIDVDPGRVDEWTWMQQVGRELVPGCRTPASCFAEYKQQFMEQHDFVVLALHPQEKVRYPGGSGSSIGGYAYPGYMVLAGQDDYIRFGYGPQVALHELLHTLGVPHPPPGGQPGRFGYFGEENVAEASIMNHVPGGVVTKRVFCQGGLCDRNSNRLFDLNEATLHFQLDTDVRCVVATNSPVQPQNPSYPVQTIGWGDVVRVVDGESRATLVLPVERLDRVTTRACYTEPLLGKRVEVLNRTTGSFVAECIGCYRNFLPAVVRK